MGVIMRKPSETMDDRVLVAMGKVRGRITPAVRIAAETDARDSVLDELWEEIQDLRQNFKMLENIRAIIDEETKTTEEQ